MSLVRAEVAVVGAGPAGLSAACRAAEAGCTVAVLDEGFAEGGQIWRHLVAPPPAEARPWIERFRASGAKLLSGAAVFEASGKEGDWHLAAERGGKRLDVRAERLVLASGARELLLPFPGWTLPGVTGAGGLQALYKGGWKVSGRRVVLAGSGPLLLAVASGLAEAGAEIVCVAEQAPGSALAGFGLRLLARPGKLLEGIRYRATLGPRFRTGWWVASAEGKGEAGLTSVALTDGARTETLRCDALGISYGLVPNTELARWLGARVTGGAIAADAGQRTSVAGLLAAGEACGVAGADVALAEGQLAGLSAAGAAADPAAAAARDRGRALASAMARAFALRPEVRRPPPPGTVVCRCEDVRAEELDASWKVRQAKLYTRVGMGACQGRVCVAALAAMLGWDADTVRSPLKPVPLSVLLSEE